MIKGMYSAGSGMNAQNRRLEVLAHNVANVNTAGFRADRVSLASFGQQFYANLNSAPAAGSTPQGVTLEAQAVSLEPGPCSQTGRQTDLAITSEGFFKVQLAAGEFRYTRRGAFVVDSEGYLALPSGPRLVGSEGNGFRVGTDGFTVAPDGTVTNAEGQVGRIALFVPKGQSGVAKEADGLFKISETDPVEGTIMQGWLEGSNTDLISAMTDLMGCARSFQACQRAFKVSDQTAELAVNEVGKIK